MIEISPSVAQAVPGFFALAVAGVGYIAYRRDKAQTALRNAAAAAAPVDTVEPVAADNEYHVDVLHKGDGYGRVYLADLAEGKKVKIFEAKRKRFGGTDSIVEIPTGGYFRVKAAPETER